MEFRHPLPTVRIVAERHPFIVSRCRGKSVLHVGCVDSGLLMERFARQELLHQKLDKVCTRVVGVDVDAPGIEFLARQGFKDVFVADISDPDSAPELAGQTFDVIILSEVLEHLPNPGLMLRAVMRYMRPGVTELLVTVPNAFSVTGLFGMAQGIEHVHPDHNFYFSHVTLRNLISKAGLQVAEELVYTFDGRNLPPRVRDGLELGRSPSVDPAMLRNGPMKRLYWKARAWPATVLRRSVNRFLFRKSVFWADGLVAICTRSS
jgi:2-polyprenyl-3-methyl-5-hydroxy-6-metoxy-1,4-benzoquinol methylase